MEISSPEDSFAPIEQRIVDFAGRYPAMPLRPVVASRLLHFLYGWVESASDSVLAPFGLTTTTWISLVMIFARGPGVEVKPSELSRVISASRAHVTRVVDFLERSGWVVRRPSRDDRRVSLLALTPAGEALVERVLPAVFAFHEALWADVSPAERDAFEKLARKLAARAGALVAAPEPS